MSNIALIALQALASLQASCSRVNRNGNVIRFRFRRCSLDALPGIQELLSQGVPFKFYTGSRIYTYDAQGNCSARNTNVVRPHAVVEVAV